MFSRHGSVLMLAISLVSPVTGQLYTLAGGLRPPLGALEASPALVVRVCVNGRRDAVFRRAFARHIDLWTTGL